MIAGALESFAEHGAKLVLVFDEEKRFHTFVFIMDCGGGLGGARVVCGEGQVRLGNSGRGTFGLRASITLTTALRRLAKSPYANSGMGHPGENSKSKTGPFRYEGEKAWAASVAVG